MKNNLRSVSVSILAVLLVANVMFGATLTWKGGHGGTPNNFNDKANWTGVTPARIPANGDDLVFNATGNANGCTLNIASFTANSVSLNSGWTNTFTLGANSLTVTNALTLTSGMISGNLTAGSVVGGSSSSYVNGTVSHAFAGAETFSFPVGTGASGGYAGVSITNASGAATVAVSSTAGTGTTTPLANASSCLNRFWTITGAISASSITFNYPAGDASGRGTEASYIAATSANPGTWVELGGTDNAGSHSLDYTPGGNFGVAGQWALGMAGALPIEINFLTAFNSDANTVSLDWNTVSETNNLGFVVERRAEGSTNFVAVSGMIQGAGTTLDQKSYSFVDATVTPGTYYYRLKQVDADGTVHYSTEQMVVVKTVLGVSTGHALEYRLNQNYPNPFNPTTQIAYEMPEQGVVTLKVFNVIGQEVAALVNGVQMNAGQHAVTFDASRFSSGLYYYRLSVKGVSKTFDSFQKMMLVK